MKALDSVEWKMNYYHPIVANQKTFFGEGFKGDKTFLLIILHAKWVYLLVILIKRQQSLNEECLSSDHPMIWGICQQVEGTISLENHGVHR